MSEVELSAVPKYAIPCVWAHKEGALIPVRELEGKEGEELGLIGKNKKSRYVG